MTEGLSTPMPSCAGTHTGPSGPNEDVGMCPDCWAPMGVLRPEGEQYGLHIEDCSLPRRHRGYCQPGGTGHAPAEIVRGFWPGMAAEVAAARARHATPAPTREDTE